MHTRSTFSSDVLAQAIALGALVWAGVLGCESNKAADGDHVPVLQDEAKELLVTQAEERAATRERIRSLRDSYEVEELDELIELMSGGDPETRGHAADGLWVALDQAADAPSSSKQAVWRETLVVDYLSPLLGASADPLAEVRFSVASILAEVAHDEAAHRLHELAQTDPDSRVRHAARRALDRRHTSR